MNLSLADSLASAGTPSSVVSLRSPAQTLTYTSLLCVLRTQILALPPSSLLSSFIPVPLPTSALLPAGNGIYLINLPAMSWIHSQIPYMLPVPNMSGTSCHPEGVLPMLGPLSLIVTPSVWRRQGNKWIPSTTLSWKSL